MLISALCAMKENGNQSYSSTEDGFSKQWNNDLSETPKTGFISTDRNISPNF